jgi:hypothetical protein
MKGSVTDTALSILQEHIIRTLLYYDIFNYPLKADEVFHFLGTNHVDCEMVKGELIFLAENAYIHRFGDFFSVKKDHEAVARRIKGNAKAEATMTLAAKRARLIGCFPFVRSVMASGSLSKNYIDENSDLDFFIVTQPGRLWIARTLLVLFKRIFLLNSHKYFCVNYFVDSSHLEIEEKNLFTATELATVIPLYGTNYYAQLHHNNQWLNQFFPNYSIRSIRKDDGRKEKFLKYFLEALLNNRLGNVLDQFFMKQTLHRWVRQYGKHYCESDFKVAFKTNKHASKNHPQNYQNKVMVLYQEKIRSFAEEFQLQWKS